MRRQHQNQMVNARAMMQQRHDPMFSAATSSLWQQQQQQQHDQQQQQHLQFALGVPLSSGTSELHSLLAEPAHSTAVVGVTATQRALYQATPSINITNNRQLQFNASTMESNNAAGTNTLSSANENPMQLYQRSNIKSGEGPLKARRCSPDPNLPSTSAASRRALANDSSQSNTNAVMQGGRNQRKDKSREKRKRRATLSSPGAYAINLNEIKSIYVWDLDETLIIFHSLLSGAFANRFNKNPNQLLEIGLRMEEEVFDLADKHFFFQGLETLLITHVDDLSQHDCAEDLSNYDFDNDGFQACGRQPKETAFRLRRIKQLFNEYRKNVGGLLGPNKRNAWLRQRQEIEQATDDWLSLSTMCVDRVSRRSDAINILMASTKLSATLAKVMLFGLGTYFPAENIFSAQNGTKLCLDQILKRYGREPPNYIFIGGTNEQKAVAAEYNIPLYSVNSQVDIMYLYGALGHDLL